MARTHIRRILIILLVFSILLIGQPLSFGPASAAPAAGVTRIVSVSSSGEQGNGSSGAPSISADGRFVAFESDATNLVDGDTNETHDIFVHDLSTGITERVSVSSGGEQADLYSFAPSISADGRFVAFGSGATNLVSGDTNGTGDIFVHDRLTGETELVSVSSSGEQGNEWSRLPSISADGRFVAFESLANNLVDRDTNDLVDVFVHDRLTGETELVSVSSSGTQGNWESFAPSISADGRFVAFYSKANTLVSGDTDYYADVFVHDRLTGEMEMVSVSSSGEKGNGDSETPSISADGRFVAFNSWASNFASGDLNPTIDIFVHDRLTGETDPVSVIPIDAQEGEVSSIQAFVSADGRYVTFSSVTSSLVDGDTNKVWDIFVHDRLMGAIKRVSVSTNGEQGNWDSYQSSITADGRYVVFTSRASNFASGDTNGTWDVFIHDRCPDGSCVLDQAIFLPLLAR